MSGTLWKNLSKDELLEMRERFSAEYEAFKAKGLKLDLSRGKPAADVLDLSNALLGGLDSYISEDGTDARNYGVLDGLPECKRLFSELLGVSQERIIIGGNSSLMLMYNALACFYLFGTSAGARPWSQEEKVKFLCPVPGYDRHFAVAEDFGVELVPVPLEEDGPDMDMVEALASSDFTVKGIWLVPLYSNPTGSVISEEKAARLARMKTAAPDFRVFWDNAYGVHHLWEACKAPDIFALCEAAGNPERALYFFSTSKIHFPGAGVSLVAAGQKTRAHFIEHMKRQTIGFDKLSQLKTVKFFDGKAENVHLHMKKIAEVLRPRFELVFEVLEHEFAGTGILEWTRPKGGYFVSVDVLDGCAKRVVSLAKEAGVTLTSAGATYPYGDDPRDSNIRIAPTYPSADELAQTLELFVLCVKLAAADKLLAIA